MQFLLIWTGEGPRTTQVIRLSLHGAEQPNVISFVTNSGIITNNYLITIQN